MLKIKKDFILISSFILLSTGYCVAQSITIKPPITTTTNSLNKTIINNNINYYYNNNNNTINNNNQIATTTTINDPTNPIFHFPSNDNLNIEFDLKLSPQKIQTSTHLDAIKSFSWILFQESKLPNTFDNLILSPITIQYLLSILEIGAESETKLQLQSLTDNINPYEFQKLLQQSLSVISPRIMALSKDDISSLPPSSISPPSSTYISLAAGIFIDSSNHLNQTFANIARNSGSDIVSLDFKNSPQKSKNSINQWAARQTHGSITNLISPTYDIGSTEIILTSAIYFNSVWKYKFNKYHGEPILFGKSSLGGGIYAQFMETKQLFKFKTIDLDNNRKFEANIIEIPYEGDDYSMIIIMPEYDISLDLFIHKLNVSTFEYILNDLLRNSPPKYLKLIMPKFRLTTHFSVVNALLKMGLVNLFTINSRLPYIGLKNNQKISDIYQNAIINVDENGTVAAAASAGVLIPLSSNRDELKLTIDKPFISVILDKKLRIPLFISKINIPTFV